MGKVLRNLRLRTAAGVSGRELSVSSVPQAPATRENAAKESQKGTACCGDHFNLPVLPQDTKPEGNASLALELALS